MKIYLQQIRAHWISGVNTHKDDLLDVLSRRGHTIVPSIEDPHDIAFIYSYKPSPMAPSLFHIHNYNIPVYREKLNPENFYSVNSEFQKHHFYLMDGFNPDRIFVLPNFVDEKKYLPTYCTKKEKSIVLLGRVQEENFDRIRTSVLAMQYLPDYTLDIVGWVFDSGRELLDGLLKQTGVKNVRILGELRDREKIECICSHQIGIGVGRAMMEMTLLGLPVLVYGHSWGGWVTPELIDKLRFDNFSTRSLERIGDSEMVERILTSIKEPRSLNRAVAFEEFGLMNNIWRYEKVFETVRQLTGDNYGIH